MITFLGIFTIIVALLAYRETNRIKFLILNSLVIIAIGFSFYLKEGYIGAFSELLMLLVHITAIILGEERRKRLSLIVPLFIFLYYIVANGISLSYEIVMPMAMSLFVYGAYQTDMARNKLSFLMGILLLSIYSFNTGTYLIFVSNTLGAIILWASYSKIKNGEGSRSASISPQSRL